MTYLDKIVDFLQYHPGLSRPELMEQLDLGIGDTQVKKILAECRVVFKTGKFVVSKTGMDFSATDPRIVREHHLRSRPFLRFVEHK